MLQANISSPPAGTASAAQHSAASLMSIASPSPAADASVDMAMVPIVASSSRMDNTWVKLGPSAAEVYRVQRVARLEERRQQRLQLCHRRRPSGGMLTSSSMREIGDQPRLAARERDRHHRHGARGRGRIGGEQRLPSGSSRRDRGGGITP